MIRGAAEFLLFLIVIPPLLAARPAAADGKEAHDLLSAAARPATELAAGREREEAAAGSTLSQEARGLGIGFGFGLLSFAEHQSSLQNSFFESTISFQDPATGGFNTRVLDGDPELNNSKFEYELDFRGVGVYSTIQLPTVPRLGDVALVFELAETDVTFEVLDTTSGSSLSSRFDGNGLIYGAGFDVTSDVAGKWSAEVGYRYRRLPSIDVERAVPIGSPFEVSSDNVSLSRERHEVTSRFFYAAGAVGSGVPDDRIRKWSYRPYAGALFRSTEVEIDDRLWLRDGLGSTTDLRTVSRFDSDVVQAVAGVEARLPAIIVNFESFFGEGDYGVQLQVGWTKRLSIALEDKVFRRSKRRLKKRDRRIDQRMKRLKKTHPLDPLGLGRIEADFRREWSAAVAGPGDRRELLIPGLETILTDTRRDLEAALRQPRSRLDRDMLPLRDYVIHRYSLAIDRLESIPRTADRRRIHRPAPSWAVLAGLDRGSYLKTSAQNDDGWRKAVEDVFEVFLEIFPILESAFEDRECGTVTIRYNTLPMGANDYLEIVYYSTGKRVGKEALRDQWRLALERGVFGFRIFANDEDYKKDEVSVDCRLDGGDVRGCPIDLADYPCLELECQSIASSGELTACIQYGDRQVPAKCGGEACPIPPAPKPPGQ